MTSITTRAGKGTPLTHTEVDDNFTNLNADKLEASNNLSDVSSASAARTNLGLATVAATGAYSDLSGLPTLGTAAATDATAYATAAQGSLADSAVQPNDSPTFTTVGAATLDFGAWTVTESAGVLYFATGGVNKMKVDGSGNLTVTGNVTAYGTV